MDSQFVFVDRCPGAIQIPQNRTSREASPTAFVLPRITKHRTRCKLKEGFGSDKVHTFLDSAEHVHLQPCKQESIDPDDQRDTWPKNVQDNRDFEKFPNSERNSDRYTKRRTSLHGKTITVRISRNETKYRKFQAQTYNFLERPKTWPSIAYHVLVFASVFGCLILSVLSTIQEYTLSAGRILLYMELAILFWFFTEYCIRLWSAGCRSRYQTWRGRFQFARRPFCIVDIIVIVASVIVLAVDSDRNMFTASALRGLRFFQILRMIRMDRRGGSFKLLASVVWAHRQELFTTVYIGFLGLIFSSFLIYLVEKKENEKIKTYADALWWGVTTLCTVGYGDTVPLTGLGKIIAGCSCLGIISFFALPPGILGSGFALKVQQHQRQKHLIRRRVPAATLIQCLWRCYAADPHSASVATWKMHMRPVPKQLGLTTSSSMIERGGFSRFSRFSTLRRRPEKTQNSIAAAVGSHAIDYQNGLNSPTDETSTAPKSAPAIEVSNNSNFIPLLQSNLNSFPVEHDESYYPTTTELNENSEKVTPAASNKTKLPADLPMVPANRFRKTVPQINDPNDTSSLTALATSGSRKVVHPSNTVDSGVRPSPNLTKQSSNERSPILQTERQLTEREKMAIRTIRKMRFLVAKRKFREALRPYDVKDVIEQYSAGHLDMLTRVKILQSRLDQILGRQGSKADDVYDSHKSLASRIVKIEHKIDAVELKIDRLSNMYKTDQLRRIPPITSNYNVGFPTNFTQSEPLRSSLSATHPSHIIHQQGITTLSTPADSGRISINPSPWNCSTSVPLVTFEKQSPTQLFLNQQNPSRQNVSCESFLFPRTQSTECSAVSETPADVRLVETRTPEAAPELVYSPHRLMSPLTSSHIEKPGVQFNALSSLDTSTRLPHLESSSTRYGLSDWTAELAVKSMEEQTQQQQKQQQMAPIDQSTSKDHRD